VGDAATVSVTRSVVVSSVLVSLVDVLPLAVLLLLFPVLPVLPLLLLLLPQAVRDKASARVKVKDKSFFILHFLQFSQAKPHDICGIALIYFKRPSILMR
jgi:hypothetical protein